MGGSTGLSSNSIEEGFADVMSMVARIWDTPVCAFKGELGGALPPTQMATGAGHPEKENHLRGTHRCYVCWREGRGCKQGKHCCGINFLDDV